MTHSTNPDFENAETKASSEKVQHSEAHVSQTTASRLEIPSIFPGVAGWKLTEMQADWLPSIPRIIKLQSASLHRRESSGQQLASSFLT